MACDDRPVCISTFYLQIRGGGIFILYPVLNVQLTYDVMIIDAVQTYLLFRGGEYNTMLAWFEPTLLYGM